MMTVLSPVRVASSDTGPNTAPTRSLDSAFAAIPRLTALRDALIAARPRPARRSFWSEPPVFFFDSRRQSELVAARHPQDGAGPGEHPLTDRIHAELPTLWASVEVRRTARAIPGLTDAAAALAPACSAARDLADLLAVPDDEAVLVLHPGLRAGFRVLVRGITDVGQFQLLLLDTLTGETSDGVLTGAPLPSRFRAAAAEVDPIIPAGVPMTFASRYQLFRPTAVQSDGTVPGGFRGSDHWLWHWEPMAAVPRIDGERVVILGEPAYQVTWSVERRFPALAAEIRLLKALGSFEVAERLARFRGGRGPTRSSETPTPLVRAA